MFVIITNINEGSEIKRLRTEVSRLTQENQALKVVDFSRETEIRAEVSKEMMERSGHLLQQIQTLQDELSVKETAVNDITKSCRKVRKQVFFMFLEKFLLVMFTLCFCCYYVSIIVSKFLCRCGKRSSTSQSIV